jgi:hypothetical protein
MYKAVEETTEHKGKETKKGRETMSVNMAHFSHSCSEHRKLQLKISQRMETFCMTELPWSVWPLTILRNYSVTSLPVCGHAVAQWLRHCATNRKVAGSIHDGVTGNFHGHNLDGRPMALGSTQPLTEIKTRTISWR